MRQLWVLLLLLAGAAPAAAQTASGGGQAAAEAAAETRLDAGESISEPAAAPLITAPGQLSGAQPLFAVPNGRLLITLGNGNLTIAPVLRLDGDAGRFWSQPNYPGGRPPLLGDGSRPGVPEPLDNVRRARLGLQGTYLKDFTYNFTWELAPGPGKQFEPERNSRIFELQTAYTGLSWATLRAGAFTLNYTLDFATSSFEMLMLERPAIINIANSIAAGDTRLAQGIEARGARWFAAGYFSQGVASALNDSGNRGLVGRAVALPVNTDAFKLALGLDMSAQFHPGTSPGENLRLRDYPEFRLEPTRLLDHGAIKNIGGAQDLGGEVSGLLGPVMFAAEYHQILTQGINGQASPNFRGWYANIAVPLVGGPRRWDGARAVWVRPRFKDLNTAEPDARGFLEFVARYSYVNLYSTPISGNSQAITSLALNYYPTQRVRVSFEYANGNIRIPGPDRAFQAMAGRLSFNW
jgi:phosphate-selective porin OprO and OprP